MSESSDYQKTCLATLKKTRAEKKIEALVKYIKEEFPAGCGDDIDCHTCPLNEHSYYSVEGAICNMLEKIHLHSE